MKLRVFCMNIDTCPMCGGELYLNENGFVGEPDILKIPGDTVFVFACTLDRHGQISTPSCGEFRISRVDPTTLDDNWKCEYVPICGDIYDRPEFMEWVQKEDNRA